jgi:hypothetical protein
VQRPDLRAIRRGGTSQTGRVSPATRKQGNGLAVAALVFGIVGLIVGVVRPPALLLGLVAVVLGPEPGARARAAQPGGPCMTVAGLLAGLVCLVLAAAASDGLLQDLTLGARPQVAHHCRPVIPSVIPPAVTRPNRSWLAELDFRPDLQAPTSSGRAGRGTHFF